MARIVEELVVIKVSKLVRNDEEAPALVTDDFMAGIEAMAGELMQDPAAVVEVIKDDE
jgi:hypothetical protein